MDSDRPNNHLVKPSADDHRIPFRAISGLNPIGGAVRHPGRPDRSDEAARNGTLEEVLAEPDNKIENIAFGATLPSHALRYLFQHSVVHLNVEWRDLSEAGWAASVLTESQTAILPLVPYLDTLRWVFIAVVLVAIAVTIYARLDDWKRGRR